MLQVADTHGDVAEPDLAVSFVSFARTNLDHSFAQNLQDLFGLWVAGGGRTGYFVEFGAMGGKAFSNSYILEKLGWDGILAEPHPGLASSIQTTRSCHFARLAVFDTTGATVKFRTVAGRPALSGIGTTQLDDDKAVYRSRYTEVSVGTITLNDLLDEYDAPAEIDFISIDTEGSEERILRAFDFRKRRVASFCIEHNFIQRKIIASIMQENGYVRLFPEMSLHDDWWVRDDIMLPRTMLNLCLADHLEEVFGNRLEQRRAILHAHAERLGL